MTKERDTVIVAVRIKKDLLDRVMQRIARRKVSRNGWLIRAILQGLRSHKRRS